MASGNVISQSIDAGKYVDKGTAITIVISSGPEQVSYYIRSQVNAPTDVTVSSADIELYKSGSNELINRWNDVTSFPYTVEAHGLDVSSGKIIITWYYIDADGNPTSSVQEKDISFKKE